MEYSVHWWGRRKPPASHWWRWQPAYMDWVRSQVFQESWTVPEKVRSNWMTLACTGLIWKGLGITGHLWTPSCLGSSFIELLYSMLTEILDPSTTGIYNVHNVITGSNILFGVVLLGKMVHLYPYLRGRLYCHCRKQFPKFKHWIVSTHRVCAWFIHFL